MGDIGPLSEFVWIAFAMFLLGMSKGGFPVGSIALPVLILVWPEEGGQQAKNSVSFMLPMLCSMDLVAMIFYRKHVLWRKVLLLVPGAVLGVGVACLLFRFDESAFFSISDKALQIIIGVIGITFVLYQAFKKWILKKLDAVADGGIVLASTFGL